MLSFFFLKLFLSIWLRFMSAWINVMWLYVCVCVHVIRVFQKHVWAYTHALTHTHKHTRARHFFSSSLFSPSFFFFKSLRRETKLSRNSTHVVCCGEVEQVNETWPSPPSFPSPSPLLLLLLMRRTTHSGKSSTSWSTPSGALRGKKKRTASTTIKKRLMSKNGTDMTKKKKKRTVSVG